MKESGRGEGRVGVAAVTVNSKNVNLGEGYRDLYYTFLTFEI